MGHKEKPAKEAAQAAIDTLGVETELSAWCGKPSREHAAQALVR